MRISDLPISDPLKRFIISRMGDVELYPPQADAVKTGVFSGENVLISTSTATGKTFLAEMVMVNTVLTRGLKSVLLVPLRAIAYEKHRDLKKYESLGLRVAVSTGEYESEDRWLERYDIIIMTYEKFDSILRHRATWLRGVGTLVIDEIHYVSDEKRGPIIESIVSKLRALGLRPQIIALSATVENCDEVASWLNAKLVRSEWRPVRLREGVYFDGTIYYSDGTRSRIAKLGDPVVDLVIDVLRVGGQALVFTSSRSNTVRIAQTIAQQIADLSINIIDLDKVSRAASEIRSSTTSRIIGEELAKCVRYGVAFHHAGLDMELRSVIENYFRDRVIKVVVSTTTLAAGVNLPARRVIIHEHRRYEPGVGMEEIPVMEYKQMAGRAGRPGLDPWGEAIMIARSHEEVEYLMSKYVRSRPEPVTSKFFDERSLAAQILAAVASGYASSIDEMIGYLSHTLGWMQRRLNAFKGAVRAEVERIIRFLEGCGFVVTKGSRVEATRLGEIVNLSYIDPYTASTYIRGLSAIAEGSDFEYLYVIVTSDEIPKLKVRRGEADSLMEALVQHRSFISKLESTRWDLEDVDELSFRDVEDVLSKVKTTLMLLEWINEAEEDVLLRKYDVGPGDLRVYCTTLEWLIHSAHRLAEVLGLRGHSERLEVLKYRVSYGVRPELIELVVNLEGIGRVRARALYDAGYRTVEDVAMASPSDIAYRVRGVGERLAESIVRQARELVKRGSVKRIKSRAHVERTTMMSSVRRSILDYLS